MKKLLLILAFIQLSLISFSQTTYTVNSPADLPDINLNDSVCVDAQGNCTLRAAIQNANKTNNKDTIGFEVSNLSKGLYFLNTTSESGNSVTIKFIKK